MILQLEQSFVGPGVRLKRDDYLISGPDFDAEEAFIEKMGHICRGRITEREATTLLQRGLAGECAGSDDEDVEQKQSPSKKSSSKKTTKSNSQDSNDE